MLSKIDLRPKAEAMPVRHRANNFDLIRLLAAVEVMIGHTIDRLDIELAGWLQPFYTVLRWFPGVPVFFALSGYLLTKSLARNDDMRQYARNRSLRIFPALWACTLVTMGLLAAAGLLFQLSPAKILAFAVAQGTIGQFWVPSPLDQWGLGGGYTPNPSLWTIRVEIGFYIILPILLLGGRAFMGWGRKLAWMVAGVALASFLLAGVIGNTVPSNPLFRLISESPAPYLWLFLGGALGALNDEWFRRLVTGRVWQWTALFLAVRGVVYLVSEYGVADPLPSRWLLNSANLILAVAAFSLAFSTNETVRRLRPPIDISYGVYLWHMVVVNTLVEWKIADGSSAFFIVCVASILIGIVSWYAVEAPALKLKGR